MILAVNAMSLFSPFSMMGAGTTGMAPGVAGVPGQVGAGVPGATPGVPSTGAPLMVGIDAQAEIARINSNIFMYNLAIGASAIGLCLSTCLFVRSIYRPAKGVHGADSDADMDSEDDEDEDSDKS